MSKGKGKGGFKQGPGRQMQQSRQPQLPQVSPEERMTLEEAKAIIQDKEKILSEAREAAAALRADAEKEKNLISEERAVLEAEKAEFAERSETLRKDHESQEILDNAEAIEAEAKRKADELIQNAQSNVTEKLENAGKEIERQKAQATSEAETKVQQANEKAESILEEARSRAQTEGDSIRNTAIADAKGILDAAHEQERIVIEGKEMAARVRADDIKTQADAYAEQKKTEADQYQQTIRERADQYETDTRHRADEKAREIQAHADEVIARRKQALDTREQAINAEEAGIPAKAEERAQETLAARKAELDSVQEQQAAREAELNRRQAQLGYDTRRLDEDRKQFDSRVKDEVEREYAQTLIELEAQRELTNEGLATIRDLNRELNEKKVELWQLKKERPDAVASQSMKQETEEIKKEKRKLETELEKYRKVGITEARIPEFLGFEAENRQLKEQVANMTQDMNDAKNSANSKAATEEQLKRVLEDKRELEKQVKVLREELDAKKVSRVDMINPIQQLPVTADVQERETDPDAYKEEIAWLEHIKGQSDASGILLPMRQFMAYHTALKIREWSPMVVLAGVSGTGKSELPRQYATHGGMRFVSVPVKPDWDSPASLFGYYNTIENKFEATELLRYLYQMQSRTGIGSTGSHAPWSKDMLVVLLDEMNLAHPEQYFADMLSKFEEARGSSNDPVYDIVLGSGEPVEPLRIGRNVLWTGTMNEDETTKGLSDKVTDRSILITFPRPTELMGRPSGQVLAPEFRISVDRWDSWKKKALNGTESVVKDEIERLRKIIEEINTDMSPMGRNLGHRVWQSMQHYILNYPTVIENKDNKDKDELLNAIKMAFCDAVAFKVMPKFRGLEVEGRNRDQFDKIGACIANNIPELLPDFNNARKLSSEVFQWCTAEFMR